MKFIYSINNYKIAYQEYTCDTTKPYIIFLHGLWSNMEANKSIYIKDFCESHDLNYICFDNFAHGHSYGLIEEFTISKGLECTEAIIKQLVKSSFIIIGASMGGWISILIAEKYIKKCRGLIGIAAAPDFTETIWRSLNEQQQEIFRKNKKIKLKRDQEDQILTFYYELFVDGVKHLLCDKEDKSLQIPNAHLLHGTEDTLVDHTIVHQISSKFYTNVSIKLLSGEGHRFSSIPALNMVSESIKEILCQP